jgi:hypothetical protein
MHLYGCSIKCVLLDHHLIFWALSMGITWCIRVRGASLRWKLAILDEDVELRPAAEPIFV